MLVLLSKIEEIDTFKSTNLHQNAVKIYLSNIMLYNCDSFKYFFLQRFDAN